VNDTSEPTANLALAEQILARRFGGRLRLEFQPGLTGGSQRSAVLRCQVLDGPSAAPASVIVKQVNLEPGQAFDVDSLDSQAQAFLNECASMSFLAQLADEGHQPIAPRLYGADSAAGLLAMEDLGQGESLVEPLLGDDRAAADAALDAYFRTLGRLGALTHPRRAEYWQIRERLGPCDPSMRPSLAGEQASLQRHLSTICAATGIQPATGAAADCAEAARFNAAPGPFAALSQSDTCPDNCLRQGDWMRLLDFEWGWVRNALNDGARARSNFPTCWCVYRLPRETIRRVEQIYRAELANGCPAASDDALFNHQLVLACASWALASFEFYDDLGPFWEQDSTWGTSTTRQRAIARLELLAETTAEFGQLEALGATVAALARRLRQRWPDVEPMQLYPAFRATTPASIGTIAPETL
jgi:hypothetical protein